MNINEGLRKLAALKGEHSRIGTRLKSPNVLTWKSENEPAFSFGELIDELNKISTQIINLKRDIACTNAQTKVTALGETVTLTAAILLLQELKGMIKFYEDLESLVPDQTPYLLNENTYINGQVNTVKVSYTAATTKRLCILAQDSFREQFNTLNAAVEAANHITPLVIG